MCVCWKNEKKWPKMIESTFDYFNNIERLMLDDDEDEKKDDLSVCNMRNV